MRLTPRRLTATFAGVAAIVAIAPAAASAACTPSSASGSEVFSQFGDTHSYVLAPDGSFASGTSGWTLDGATVQSTDGVTGLGVLDESHSLAIAPGAATISAPFCVSSDQPDFRFLARRSSGSWAEMNVSVIWTDSAGVTETDSAGGLSASSGWTPTQVYDLGEMLPTENGQTYTVRLEFLPAAGGGAVSIGDLYIDPFNRAG